MNPSLDEYQIEALKKLKTGSILKGGVGSGKSRTGLAYYFCVVCGGLIDGKSLGYDSDYIPMTDPKDLYIFTTARKRDDKEWEDELIPFLLSADNQRNLYGNDIKVVVDSWNNIAKYISIKNSFVIFDEQKAIGSGPWSKAFITIAKNNDWIMLSATPGDNWEDYVSVFIANGFFKNRKEFFDRHAVYSRYSKYPKIDRYLEEQKLRKLRDLIVVEMDYRNPTNRIYKTVMADYDRVKYRKLLRDRWNFEEGRPVDNASELLYLMRKIVNSDASRVEHVLSIARKHEKVIIFYNFNYERDILLSLDYGPEFVIKEWNGFNHNPVPEEEKWVYIVQYAAGAEAWNCTTTNTIIFYSMNYSYKIFEQACGRIDRRNTRYTDLYYYIFRSSSSIDAAIYGALRRKKNFNEKKFFSQF